MQQFKSKTMEVIVPELDRNLSNQLMKLTRNDQHIAVLTGHNFLLHHEKNMQMRVKTSSTSAAGYAIGRTMPATVMRRGALSWNDDAHRTRINMSKEVQRLTLQMCGNFRQNALWRQPRTRNS